MGREWTRKSIEELIDDEVRMMIKNGEITPPDPGDHGGVLPDVGQPFNAPYYFYTPAQSVSSYTAVKTLGYIKRCLFHVSAGTQGNSNSIYTQALSPMADSANVNVPIATSFSGYTNVGDTPAALAYHLKDGFCATLNSTKLGQYYQRDFLIMANSSSGNATVTWSAGDLISGHSDTSIATIPLIHGSDSGAGDALYYDNRSIKATMMIGFNSSYVAGQLKGATEVIVYDNIPPFYFVSLAQASSVSNTIGSITYNTPQYVFHHLGLAVILKNSSQIDALEAFFALAFPNYINLYTLQMDDNNIKKLVNPANPNTVTVTHYNLGW